MRIIVAGGSGFIGRYLIPALVADGHTVTVLTRARQRQHVHPEGLLHYVHWAPLTSDGKLADILADTDAVVNLAGTNIGSRQWTRKRKVDLLNSRVRSTETLVQAIARLEPDRRPHTLVNASGIDLYGDRGDEVLTEGSLPGESFLAQLCKRWEHAASEAQSLGLRIVMMRTAVVLAFDAPTLPLMVWPFRLFLGGPLGDGRQWFPWIHIEDVVGLYKWVLDTDMISGPVNVVAPNVNTHVRVARTFGTVLRRPYGSPTPASVLRLAMGERADLLLHSRRAVPEKALAHGYTFHFPLLEMALRNCLRQREARRISSGAMEVQSPFFPVLGEIAERMPGVLRDQYLVRPEDNYRVVLEGSMDRIWHRPFWLWPFFRLLAAFNILFPDQGRDIAVLMVVEGQHDKQGNGIQTWYRTFGFRKSRKFDATMGFDFRLARVIEWIGPGRILKVIWNVTFEPSATIHIVTEGIQIGVGKWRLLLPHWAAVEVRASETVLTDRSDTIEVYLVVRHLWLGEIFGYTGRFQVHREIKGGHE